MVTPTMTTSEPQGEAFAARKSLRLQSWLSPAFPSGGYSYSHGLEWAAESGDVHDLESLVDWLDADLRHGSPRNDAIFFSEAWRRAATGNIPALLETCELAAAFRGTAELALEAAQPGASALAIIRKAWPDSMLDAMASGLSERELAPVYSTVLAVACARNNITLEVALPLFLQAGVANLVSAAIRLIPLGQTEGQIAVARLEGAIRDASETAIVGSLDDLGSSCFMVDLASMAHETQYTRLFRS
jgi:urease accessory protein